MKYVVSDVENTKEGHAKEGKATLHREVSLNSEWEPERTQGRGQADIWERAAWSDGTKLHGRRQGRAEQVEDHHRGQCACGRENDSPA